MEKTQKLLSIALTVLALDGWGAASAKPEEPSPSPSPRSSSHTTSRPWHSSGFFHSHIHHGAAAVAGGAMAGLHANRSGKSGRGAAKGGGKGSGGGHGFGGAGAHGGGG